MGRRDQDRWQGSPAGRVEAPLEQGFERLEAGDQLGVLDVGPGRAAGARPGRRTGRFGLQRRRRGRIPSAASAPPGSDAALCRAACSLKLEAIWAVTTARMTTPEHHQTRGGQPAAHRDGGEVAVADGGHGDDGPPERLADRLDVGPSASDSKAKTMMAPLTNRRPATPEELEQVAAGEHRTEQAQAEHDAHRRSDHGEVNTGGARRTATAGPTGGTGWPGRPRTPGTRAMRPIVQAQPASARTAG